MNTIDLSFITKRYIPPGFKLLDNHIIEGRGGKLYDLKEITTFENNKYIIKFKDIEWIETEESIVFFQRFKGETKATFERHIPVPITIQQLPSSGAISLYDVNEELGKSRTSQVSLKDADVRDLANKPTGPISLYDLRGKSSESYNQTSHTVTLKGEEYKIDISRWFVVSDKNKTINPTTTHSGHTITGMECVFLFWGLYKEQIDPLYYAYSTIYLEKKPLVDLPNYLSFQYHGFSSGEDPVLYSIYYDINGSEAYYSFDIVYDYQDGDYVTPPSVTSAFLDAVDKATSWTITEFDTLKWGTTKDPRLTSLTRPTSSTLSLTWTPAVGNFQNYTIAILGGSPSAVKAYAYHVNKNNTQATLSVDPFMDNYFVGITGRGYDIIYGGDESTGFVS